MAVNWKAISAYFTLYAQSIFRNIPPDLYLLLLLITTVGIILIFTNHRVKCKWQVLGQLVFFEYVAFILCITIFCRECIEDRVINLTPFWSYTAESADLQHSLYVECLMNVLMFVPVGLLISCVSKHIRWMKMLVVTVGLSVSIEVLQFIFRRGYAEFDDVFHNTLGAAIGFGLYAVGATIVKCMLNRKTV